MDNEVQYRDFENGSVDDGYSQILREASEYFAGQRIQMFGQGFQEIISEQALFDTYVDKLTKGLDASSASQAEQLMENARTQILSESSISGIEPIAGLSMPTVRKMWDKVAMKHAMPTQVVKKPKFVISYSVPYIQGDDGVKHELPGAIRNDIDNDLHERNQLDTDPITVPTDDEDLLASSGADKASGYAIDPDFRIVEVEIEVVPEDEGTYDTETQTVEVDFKIDMDANLYGEVEAEHSEEGTTVTDSLFGNVDLTEGIFNARSLKDNIQSVVVQGYLESGNNEKQESVSFDIKNKDVTIGSGSHINAPLPVEWLQDTMAMYNIDGAAEVVDLMSNVTALKLEQEIIKFLDASFDRAGEPWKSAFDVMPPSNFSHGSKEWREELKRVVDWLANKMKKDTSFNQGKFVIAGSPMDAQLLPNVDWVFNHVSDDRGGVKVDFNIGAYSGSNRYEVVASNNMPEGTLRIIFVPDTPKQMTYKYYPYTFTVEKGYNNPQQTLVPNVMMTKRHTIEELKPISAEIEIYNNNGKVSDRYDVEGNGYDDPNYISDH